MEELVHEEDWRNLDNYGIYRDLVINGTITIHTSEINDNNIGYHFASIHNILCDGIDQDIVQKCMIHVVFVDGVELNLSIFDYYMNIIFWKLATSSGEHIDSLKLFFPDNISEGYIAEYINNVFVDKYRMLLPVQKRNNIIDDTLYPFRKMSQFQAYLMNTLCMKDFVDLMNQYPEFEKTMHFSVDGIPFEDIKDEGLKVANIQKQYIINSKDHCFKDQFLTGEIISIKQYKEVFVNKGTSPSGNGDLYPVPVKTSFINGGLNTPEAVVIESGVGRIAKILEKRYVGRSGEFARVLGLNNKETYFNYDPDYSCNTKNLMKVTIKNAKWLKSYNMRYYRLEKNGKEYVIDGKRDTHLIGQTIWVRSPMTCASFAAGKGICRRCYGNLYYDNIILNPGKLAAELESSIFTQKLLSAKHLLESAVIKLEWNEEFYVLFQVDFNTITKREDFDYKGYTLVITGVELSDEDIDDPSYEYCVYEFTVVDPTGKSIVCKTASEDPIYINEALLDSIDADNKESVREFDLASLDCDIFNIVVSNVDLSATMQSIKKLIDNKSMILPDKDAFLDRFVEANMEGGVNLDAIHFEMLLSNQIRDKDNWKRKPHWEYEDAQYDILRLSESLFNSSSITTRLQYSEINRVLINPSSYEVDSPSDYDLYFMEKPQYFLSTDGILTDDKDLIMDDDDLMQSPFAPLPEDEE